MHRESSSSALFPRPVRRAAGGQRSLMYAHSFAGTRSSDHRAACLHESSVVKNTGLWACLGREKRKSKHGIFLPRCIMLLLLKKEIE